MEKKIKKIRFMQGNEACAEGALYAGCRFFGGYPITPSTEIAEIMSRRLPEVGGKFIQMEDEIGAICAVIGASLAGSKALTATSGPGFSLKQEAIGYGMMTEIPCVIINIMRGGPSTGLPTGPGQSDVMQAKWGTHGDHPVICLTPWSVEELFHETIRAFNLSEKYRTPVMVLADEIIGHMREVIELPEASALEVINREKPFCAPKDYFPYDTNKGDIPPLAPLGEGYRFHVTGLNHDQTGFPTTKPELLQSEEERLLRKIKANIKDISKNDLFRLADAEIVIIAYGSTARSARYAVKELRKEGIKAGMFRPITLWPFPEQTIKEISRGVKKIIVPELNLGQIIQEVARCSQADSEPSGINRVDGEPITPQQIIDKAREVLKLLR